MKVNLSALQGILQKKPLPFLIIKISNDSSVFIISEIGINHNGSLETAKDLIRQSHECGADAVKLQVRDLESLYTASVLNDSLKAEHGTQYLLNELKKIRITF